MTVQLTAKQQILTALSLGLKLSLGSLPGRGEGELDNEKGQCSVSKRRQVSLVRERTRCS